MREDMVASGDKDEVEAKRFDKGTDVGEPSIVRGSEELR